MIRGAVVDSYRMSVVMSGDSSEQLRSECNDEGDSS